MKKTLHVKQRCQQRGIREEMMSVVADFGIETRASGGASHVVLGKKHCQFIEGVIEELIWKVSHNEDHCVVVK